MLVAYADSVDPASCSPALLDSQLCFQWLRAFWTEKTRRGRFSGILILKGLYY